MDRASWIFIENEGALYRGPSRGWPKEVYSFRRGCWLPYEGKIPKPVDWGDVLSKTEAQALIADAGSPPSVA